MSRRRRSQSGRPLEGRVGTLLSSCSKAIQVGFAQTAALVVLVQALENMEKLCGLARGGPESATENLENSKQSYEKRVISFVKLACLFCKASARRRSIDLIFSVKLALRRPISSSF